MKKIFGILFLLAINIAVVMAQPPANPGVSPGNNGDVGSVGSSVPLDGGAIELLLAGSVLIGYKKSKAWFKNRKAV